jgi:hypothetical protein
MLKPFKRVMAKYKTLIVKMSRENVSVAQARFDLNLLCHLHVVGLVLFVAIVGGSECLNQICAKEGCFHL